MCNEPRAVNQNLRTDPPLKISLQELEKATFVHKELLSDLFVQLSPVMKPPTPEVCSDTPQLVVANKSEVCKESPWIISRLSRSKFFLRNFGISRSRSEQTAWLTLMIMLKMAPRLLIGRIFSPNLHFLIKPSELKIDCATCLILNLLTQIYVC